MMHGLMTSARTLTVALTLALALGGCEERDEGLGGDGSEVATRAHDEVLAEGKALREDARRAVEDLDRAARDVEEGAERVADDLDRAAGDR